MLKDALLFQAQRRRAAELAGLLRPGTGRHHARQTIGLVLPPYVPAVAPVVAQTPDRPVEVFDARCSPVKVPGSEALQVAADGSPSPRALATPAGPPSETRSITRMEGVPEWPTVRKPGSATAGRPTATPALPAPPSAPRFTPMEGVLERDAVRRASAGPGSVRRGLDLRSPEQPVAELAEETRSGNEAEARDVAGQSPNEVCDLRTPADARASSLPEHMHAEGAAEPKTPYAALQRAADGQPAALEDGPGLATALSSDDDVPEYGAEKDMFVWCADPLTFGQAFL